MCGLVACITKSRNGFNQFDLDAFGEMLFADTLRGPDSTGIFAINSMGNVGVVKDVGTAENFLKTDEYKAASKELFKDGWAVVGHNRKATRGQITDVNAHPFWVEDKLVLVHNGTYFGDHKKLADVEVDSHAIAHHLANNIDDPEAALKGVNAAYALIWYDIANKKLNLIRNKDRPLWKVETHNAYYFASEAGILGWILSRNDLKRVGTIELLDEHTLHTFTLNDNQSYEVEEKKLDCFFRWTNQTQANSALDDCDDYCGYGAWRNHQGGNNWHQTYHPPKPTPAPAANAPRVLTPPESSGKSEFDRIRDLCIPTAAHPHFKHAEWLELIMGPYKKGNTLNVVVDDWVHPTDDKDTSVYLKGTTLDARGIPVIFKIDNSRLNHLIYSSSFQDDGLCFEIEVDAVVWKKDQSNTPATVDLKEINGVMFIVGKNDKIILTGANNGATH